MKSSLRLGSLALALAALVCAPAALAKDPDNTHGRQSAPGQTQTTPRQRSAPTPALAAPAISSCGEADGNATVTWAAVDGATKYSVEFDVGYDRTGSDGCADAFLEFEYDATDTTLTVPLTDFDHDFCDSTSPCVKSPVSITVKVKALDPPSGGPKGSGHPQNNPFSGSCVVLSDGCKS